MRLWELRLGRLCRGWTGLFCRSRFFALQKFCGFPHFSETTVLSCVRSWCGNGVVSDLGLSGWHAENERYRITSVQCQGCTGGRCVFAVGGRGALFFATTVIIRCCWEEWLLRVCCSRRLRAAKEFYCPRACLPETEKTLLSRFWERNGKIKLNFAPFLLTKGKKNAIIKFKDNRSG